MNALEQQIRQVQQEMSFQSTEFVVEMLVDKYLKGDLYIPEYQRKFIWSKAEQCRFIESLFLGIPIPAFFYKEDMEGYIAIVDGLQRLLTLVDWLTGVLKLEGLEVLTEANGMVFDDLTVAQQRRFKNKSVKGFKIADVVLDGKVIDIFKRINARDMSLQEHIKGL